MSKPILYYAPRSPPCRSVLLTAAAIGLDLDLKLTILKNGDHMTPEFLKLNPLHTIPVLDDGNGVVITDSHVICEYLADKYSKDENLYPKDMSKRLSVKTLLYYDAANLFSRVRSLFEPVIYFGCDELPQDKLDYMKKTYPVIENCLKDHEYLSGNHLTIADLCCVASLSSVDNLLPIDKNVYPNFYAWMERMKSLPYYNEANGNGAKTIQQYVTEQMAVNKNNKFPL